MIRKPQDVQNVLSEIIDDAMVNEAILTDDALKRLIVLRDDFTVWLNKQTEE